MKAIENFAGPVRVAAWQFLPPDRRLSDKFLKEEGGNSRRMGSSSGMGWIELRDAKLIAGPALWVFDGISIMEAVWTQHPAEEPLAGHFQKNGSEGWLSVTHVWEGTERPQIIPEIPKSEASIIEEELRKREG